MQTHKCLIFYAAMGMLMSTTLLANAHLSFDIKNDTDNVKNIEVVVSKKVIIKKYPVPSHEVVHVGTTTHVHDLQLNLINENNTKTRCGHAHFTNARYVSINIVLGNSKAYTIVYLFS